MNKNIAIAIIAGLVIGVAGTLGVRAAIDTDKAAINSQTAASTKDHNEQATAKLADLKGDDFDKAFIEEMILHHQGAIDMAKLINSNAKHEELKKLGQAIISAQSSEIDMMQTWQTEWGYKANSESHTTH